MSVIKFGLRPGRSVDIGKITEGKAKATWLAVTDNNNDTEAVISSYGYNNALLPVPFISFHPSATVLGVPLLCRGVTFNQDSSAPRKWTIEATYSSEPLKSSDSDQAENPLDRPPEIKWSSQQYREALFRDVNGKAIVNSAGDYFDPPVEREASYWVATVSKNVSSVPFFIIEYTDAINADSFSISGAGVGPRVAKLMDIGISERQTSQVGDSIVVYYTFSYSMMMKPETWRLKILDQGFRYKDGDDVLQITDDSTPPRAVSSPRLLNGSGDILDKPSPETAKYREFDIYSERPFSVLPGINELA